MKKTTYFILGGVIILLLIGIGAFNLKSNSVKGNAYGNSSQAKNDTTETQTTTEMQNTTSSQNKADSKTETGAVNSAIGEFNSIEADIDAINLEIKPGEQYSIENRQNIAIDYSNQNKVLKLTQQGRISGDDDYATVTVTVPKDKILESINITNDTGDAELYQISGKKLIYAGTNGDLEVVASNIESVDVKEEMGDIEFDNMQFQQMVIENKSGDAEVKAAADLSNYSILLQSKSGEVEVNDTKHGNEYKNNVQSDKKLEITTSTGDIDVEY